MDRNRSAAATHGALGTKTQRNVTDVTFLCVLWYSRPCRLSATPQSQPFEFVLENFKAGDHSDHHSFVTLCQPHLLPVDG